MMYLCISLKVLVMLARRNNTTGIWQATGALDLQRKEEAFQARKKWREKNPSPLGTQRISSFLIG